MMRFWRRRWVLLAATVVGTAMQLTACQEELSLLALRTAFTSVTLPINQLIRQLLLGV